MPVVPATQEAEVGELLEPRRSRLQGAMIVLLHCSLRAIARLPLKRKKKIKRNKIGNREIGFNRGEKLNRGWEGMKGGWR